MFKTFQFAVTFVAILTPLVRSQTQNVARSDGPQEGVVLTKLTQPVYPPLARQLRVTGDVALMLSIRQDGRVESAVLESGHPLLAEAALTSVRQSQFECRGCRQGTTSYRLVYTFNLDGDCPCMPRDSNSRSVDKEQFYPRVSEAEHRVTLVGWVACICDSWPVKKIRSWKCLYLWKCGPQVPDLVGHSELGNHLQILTGPLSFTSPHSAR